MFFVYFVYFLFLSWAPAHGLVYVFRILSVFLVGSCLGPVYVFRILSEFLVGFCLCLVHVFFGVRIAL